jgi:hypothetical protein
MKNFFNEGNQIHKLISSSGSGTVINYGSGSDFLTSYGSGSTSQKVPYSYYGASSGSTTLPGRRPAPGAGAPRAAAPGSSSDPALPALPCTIQCCGSGSGIRYLFDPWFRDPGWVKSRDPDPG